MDDAIAFCYPKELIVLDCKNNGVDVIVLEELIVLDDENNDVRFIVPSSDDSDSRESELGNGSLFEKINTYFEKFYMKVQYTKAVRTSMRR